MSFRLEALLAAAGAAVLIAAGLALGDKALIDLLMRLSIFGLLALCVGHVLALQPSLVNAGEGCPS